MKLLKLVSWTAAHIAWVTMSFSPLALGAESDRLSKQNLQQYLQEAGLNKQITYGEFWNRTRNYYPGYVLKQMEPLIKQNKNVMMPEFTVSTAKGTDGGEVTTLTFSESGKMHTMQFYGEKNKWVKFDAINISGEDFKFPENILKRWVASDINNKKDVDALQKKAEVGMSLNYKLQDEYRKDFSRFKGFPVMTPQLWKSLSKQDRASFIVKMRLMWSSAQKVLEASGNGKTSAANTPSSLFENLYQSSMTEANAAGPAKSGTTSSDSQASSTALKEAAAKAKAGRAARASKEYKSPYDADSCIVAGYVGKYADKLDKFSGKGPGCSVMAALEGYKTRPELEFVTAATEFCQLQDPMKVACNPVIYGYPNNGDARCISRKDPDFDVATHFKGPCEKDNHLFSSADLDYSKIQPRSKQIEAIDADQKKDDYAATQKFLEGMLKHRGKGSLADVIDGKKPWSEELDDELVTIQRQFEKEINTAMETCEKEVVKKNEPNQKGACDQLHRRWLFTERFIAKIRQKACPVDSIYVGSYEKDETSLEDSAVTPADKAKAANKSALNKGSMADFKGANLCECNVPTDTGKVTVPFVQYGGSCAVTPTPPPIPVVTINGQKCPKGSTLMEGGDSNECICNDNKEKRVMTSTPPEDVAKLCEKETNLWPLAAFAGIALLGYLWWKHNTKDPKPPVIPLVCPANQKLIGGSCQCKAVCAAGESQNGSCGCDKNPTNPVCTGNKIPGPVAGQCVCGPCAAGQTQSYNSTCQCTVNPVVSCDDGSVAPGGNRNNCPKCADGSYKTATGCPAPASETNPGATTNPNDNGAYTVPVPGTTK